jgi:hypothetical protein
VILRLRGPARQNAAHKKEPGGFAQDEKIGIVKGLC